MDRQEEYNNILTELDNTPPALEYTIARAKARAKKAERIRRLVVVPVSGISIFFITFAVMVNVSSTFAMACGQIPLLRELAAAVAFSPSLSAAVENEYVQPIELEQSENGITMRVEYVIVDQRQLNIFYSLHSESYFRMDATPSISKPDGTPFDGYAVSTGYSGDKNGELRIITVDFMNGDMPSDILLTCRVHDNDRLSAPEPVKVDLLSGYFSYTEPEYISTFTFTLNIDPAYTQKGEVITLNESFILDGQRLTVETVEIYPTHISLNIGDDEGNSAWLQSLNLYLENEKGERFERISNGISGAGSEDSPMIKSYRLESPFFSESKHLTLYITDAVWLDKDMERVKVDLANCAADTLPEGVVFENSVRYPNGWELTFSAPERGEYNYYQLFGSKYFDEDGNEYGYNVSSSYGQMPGRFAVQFALLDYPYDTVYLSPIYSRTIKLETPVVIKVK